MSEQEQLLMELTEQLEAKNLQISQMSEQLKQNKQLLSEANATIIALSESDLQLKEAEKIKAEADKLKEDAERDLRTAENEKAGFLETKEKIQKEKDEWISVKQKQADYLAAEKLKQDKEYRSRIATQLKIEKMKYKLSYAAVSLYGIVLTLGMLINNGVIKDLQEIIQFLVDAFSDFSFVAIVFGLFFDVWLPVLLVIYSVIVHCKNKLWGQHNLNFVLLSMAVICLAGDIIPVNLILIAIYGNVGYLTAVSIYQTFKGGN